MLGKRERHGVLSNPSSSVCVPTVSPSFDYIPFDSPLVLAQNYTFQAGDTTVPTPTTPVYFEFLLNGISQQNSTATDWLYTLVDGDIVGKNGSGLGHITVKVIARNACNVVGSSSEDDIPAQGTP